MAQPMKAADPVLQLPRYISTNNFSVTAAISAEVTQNQDGSYSLSLSGGNLQDDGWEAFGTMIILQPASEQPLPVLYEFDLSFNEGFELDNLIGLQISDSASSGSRAACVVSPLRLLHNLESGSFEMNLGLIVLDLMNPTPITITFDDPTIVFGPPQT